MSDFDKLLKDTLEKVEGADMTPTQDMVLVCGHKVESYIHTLIVSASLVGLNRSKSIQICTSCAHTLYDKSHPDHKNVKSLIKRKASI